MEKKELFITLGVLSILLLSVLATAASSSPKIDSKIETKLKIEDEVRVIVKLKETDIKSIKTSSILNDLDDGFKIKNKLSKGFTGKINKAGLEKLKADSRVEQVWLDKRVYMNLDGSIPQINSDEVWNLQVNGINLTGAGETICVIDTGIDYTHDNLGNCTITQFSLTGNNESIVNESAHNYTDNYDNTWKITKTNYTNIALHFKNISLEYQGEFGGYDTTDRVIIYNGDMEEVAIYHGINGIITDLWTPHVEGDTIYVRLISDSLFTDYGFYIDYVLNGTTNTTYNWSSCNTVIGGWDFINNDGDPIDDEGHGTHVTGIIISDNETYKGVAPDAKIVSMKALDSSGSGWYSDIILAIDSCINISEEYNISVISMSLSDCSNHTNYCSTDASDSYIDAAVAKGIIVVSAAGNGNGGSCSGITDTIGPAAPACAPNAIAIGAVNNADTIFYQRGPNIFELFAPGVNIMSTNYTGGMVSLSGTSMATPHAAGAIALLQQFSKLYDGSALTLSEVKNTLNDSGVVLNDSGGTGNLFSRIDILAAILSLDDDVPDITLVEPEHNLMSDDINQTFKCNATDLLLENITFYLWNSTSLVNNQSVLDINTNSNESEFNVTNLAEDNYFWNCKVCDNQSNCDFAASNFTLVLEDILVTLNSPSNNTYRRLATKNIDFNCTAQTINNSQIDNITLMIWDNIGVLEYNESKNASNQENTTIFSIDLSTIGQGDYSWNCIGRNNESKNASAIENYTITYDTTYPNIDLDNPDDDEEYTGTSKTVTFEYQVTDSSGINNCKLYVDDELKTTDNSIVTGITQSFSRSFSGSTGGSDYDWVIECTDNAGNSDNSSERTFTVTESSDGGGGGGSPPSSDDDDEDEPYYPPVDRVIKKTPSETSTPGVYNVLKIDLQRGYNKTLFANEQLKFSLTIEKESNTTNGTKITIEIQEQHTITINKIATNSVDLTIQSSPINLNLSIGEERKLNLSSPDYNNLYIKLNNITNGKADLTIQEINQPKSVLLSIGNWFVDRWNGFKAFFIKNKVWIIAIFAVIIIIIIHDLIQYHLIKKGPKKIKITRLSDLVKHKHKKK